jgi:hypothetical protein
MMDVSTKFLENPHGSEEFCLYTDTMHRPEGLGEKQAQLTRTFGTMYSGRADNMIGQHNAIIDEEGLPAWAY